MILGLVCGAGKGDLSCLGRAMDKKKKGLEALWRPGGGGWGAGPWGRGKGALFFLHCCFFVLFWKGKGQKKKRAGRGGETRGGGLVDRHVGPGKRRLFILAWLLFTFASLATVSLLLLLFKRDSGDGKVGGGWVPKWCACMAR